MAHSYVRGNWRNEKESSFMLLAKSCHDIDWICYIMGQKCESVSSFGSLLHFKKENKPVGGGDRCLNCAVESKCPYSAKKIYMETKTSFSQTVTNTPTMPDIEEIEKALQTSPYGRCVYECDNDVVDNQVVNMQFKGGATASFSMVGCTESVCIRKTRIFGSLGELQADGHEIKHYDFLTRKSTIIPYELAPETTSLRGHDGADYFLMKAFVENVLGSVDKTQVLSNADESLASHLLCFAAERARKTNSVVTL